MRILVYEFIVGGGMLGADAPAESLRREGQAMVTALAADFVAASAEVDVLRDVRHCNVPFPGCRVHDVATSNEETVSLGRLARQADWTLVIAPEFDGCLLDRCRLVESAGGRLLGPSSGLVAMASDKQRTAEHLASAGVPVPQGVPLFSNQALPLDFAYPAVLKPRDGAGSLGVRLLQSAEEARDVKPADTPTRLERFTPGIAASVAFLCGPRGDVALLPCRQQLSDDGRFAYLGGSLPLKPHLAARATELATRAVETLPGRLGYLGVDLVLGSDATGRDDVVIEINPRLTTSYVGLRTACRDNLAVAMLATADAAPPRLSFDTTARRFDADGRTWPTNESLVPHQGDECG